MLQVRQRMQEFCACPCYTQALETQRKDIEDKRTSKMQKTHIASTLQHRQNCIPVQVSGPLDEGLWSLEQRLFHLTRDWRPWLAVALNPWLDCPCLCLPLDILFLQYQWQIKPHLTSWSSEDHCAHQATCLCPCRFLGGTSVFQHQDTWHHHNVYHTCDFTWHLHQLITTTYHMKPRCLVLRICWSLCSQESSPIVSTMSLKPLITWPFHLTWQLSSFHVKEHPVTTTFDLNLSSTHTLWPRPASDYLGDTPRWSLDLARGSLSCQTWQGPQLLSAWAAIIKHRPYSHLTKSTHE